MAQLRAQEQHGFGSREAVDLLTSDHQPIYGARTLGATTDPAEAVAVAPAAETAFSFALPEAGPIQRRARSEGATPALDPIAASVGARPTGVPGASDWSLAADGRLVIQRRAGGATTDGATTAPAGNGAGEALDGATRARMEGAFGADFSSVRVHQGRQADALGAVAYAQGHDLHFAPGEYRPGTAGGDELLGHELAHVVQQGQGRVAVPQGKGAAINDDPALEAEADRAGAQVARGERVEIAGSAGHLASGAGPIQARRGKKVTGGATLGHRDAISADFELDYLDDQQDQQDQEQQEEQEEQGEDDARPEPTTEVTPQIGRAIQLINDAAIRYRGGKHRQAIKLLTKYDDRLGTDVGPKAKRIPLLEDAVTALRQIANTQHKKKLRDDGWPQYRAAIVTAIQIIEREIVIARSHLRIAELQQEGDLEGGSYHGTHSGLMTGLERGNSTSMLPAAELERRGVTRSSGEGDFFSAGGQGEKEFISVGQGELGLGTALTYAMAPTELQNYNVERYTDEQLQAELKKVTKLIDRWDDGLLQQVQGSGDHKSVEQFTALKNKLQREADYRETLAENHPRRQGKSTLDSSYPLFLQLDLSGLDVRDDGGLGQNERAKAEGGSFGDLPGERMVYGGGGIDLAVRLVRAYAPADRLDEVRQRLTAIVGHGGFEVLAIEAFGRLPDQTWVKGALLETMTQLREFEATRKSLIDTYHRAMKTGEPLTSGQVIASFKQHKRG